MLQKTVVLVNICSLSPLNALSFKFVQELSIEEMSSFRCSDMVP